MNLAILQAKCEIKKFLLNLVIKYEHSKYIVGKPNVVESFGRFHYKNKINLYNHIKKKKIVYKDGWYW